MRNIFQSCDIVNFWIDDLIQCGWYVQPYNMNRYRYVSVRKRRKTYNLFHCLPLHTEKFSKIHLDNIFNCVYILRLCVVAFDRRLNSEKRSKRRTVKKIRLMMGYLLFSLLWTIPQSIFFCCSARLLSLEMTTTTEDMRKRRRHYEEFFGQTFFDSGQLMTLIEHEWAIFPLSSTSICFSSVVPVVPVP